MKKAISLAHKRNINQRRWPLPQAHRYYTPPYSHLMRHKCIKIYTTKHLLHVA